jgi:hypothetical protein
LPCRGSLSIHIESLEGNTNFKRNVASRKIGIMDPTKRANPKMPLLSTDIGIRRRLNEPTKGNNVARRMRKANPNIIGEFNDTN